MTPDDVAGFASRVPSLSDDQIDRVYHFALLVQQDAAPMAQATIVEEWRSLQTEDGALAVEDEGSLDFVLDVAAVEPGANLGDKILGIFESANVDIVTSSPPPRPASPDSIESIDETDPRWQQAVALDRKRLASQALGVWNDLKNEQRAEYEVYEDPAATKLADGLYNARVASRALDSWRGELDDIRDMEETADQVLKRKDAASALQKWTLATRESILFRARQQRLARKFLEVWRRKTAESRARRAQADRVEARQQTLAIEYFTKWRVATRKSKEAKYDAAYKIMRRRIKTNIARTVLNIWREKTRRLRQMRETADELRASREEEHARRTAHGAIVTMYNQTEQTREAERQADAVYNQNLVDRLQIFGSAWLDPTRQILRNQNIADDYRQTREASHASGVLRDWRNAAFRTQRLEEDAEALRQRRERERGLALLQRWRAAAAASRNERGHATENTLLPATPAARRSQLLASTTPAYTPAAGLFSGSGPVVEEQEDEEEE